LVACLGSLLISRIQNTIGDEYASYPQIEQFRQGNWAVQDNLAVPPTYHALIALLARLFDVSSWNALRLITLVLSSLAILFFYASARAFDAESASAKTAQFLFLPILLPYCFILYTDPLAVALFLLSVWLALRNHPVLAGLAALLDVAVRQNQIVWVAFLFLWLYLRESGWSFKRAVIGRYLVRYGMFVAVFIGFAVFVVVNRGLTLGQHSTIHPPGRFYLGNVWFALFICTFLFLPVFLADLPRLAALVRKEPVFLLGLAVLFPLYLLTFSPDHAMNQLPEFLHNQVLAAASASWWTKALFFIPIGFAVLSLAATPLRESSCDWLYPFWVLAVLPAWLIEQRYSLTGIALFQLFRQPQGERAETMLLVYWMMLSVFFLVGISQGWFFL
jgi:alpha-1,2-glucosyltransferase